MGSAITRLRGRGQEEDEELIDAAAEFHDARSELLPEPRSISGHQQQLIGVMPFTQTNCRTFLQGLFNLLLSAIDNDTTENRPAHELDRLRVTRYALVPRNSAPLMGDLQTQEPSRSIWMSDEWFCLLAKALKGRQEDILSASRGRTQCGLLHLAARMNFPLTTYEILRDMPSLVDLCDENGNTPLMEAASYASLEAMLVLFQCGANPALRNDRRETSLHLCASKPNCCERKREKCLVLLLEHTTRNINTQDVDGNTPLHRATGTHRVSERTLVILVRSGADGSLKNKDGLTPLHYYLKCLSNWTEVFASIISPMPIMLYPQTRKGLKAIYSVTPKFQSMLTDSAGNHPAIIDMGNFQIFKEAFFRKDPLSLEEMTVDVIRRSVGLNNILDKTLAWRNLRIPRCLRKLIRENSLRELFEHASIQVPELPPI